VADSLTDAGFNEDETKLGIGYEDELWGASASLRFGNENLKFLNGEIGEMFAGFPLALDELYGWVKPFGEHFKFTGGLFDNTGGLADYTDDKVDFAKTTLSGSFGDAEDTLTAFSIPIGFVLSFWRRSWIQLPQGPTKLPGNREQLKTVQAVMVGRFFSLPVG
jgi:hypothetical protein